ncbi:MAG TPA: phosphoglucomutase/phosphomannomutase family protein [Thermoanaerobaculia bacterium]|nr:phosphoglucomutase/phosphomannomutase family protein [Thermoanaerobaculia bacterium]
MTPIRFGTSGWRAVLAEEFTFANARRVITAICRVLSEEGRGGELVLVGYDTRFLADRFAAEAARIVAREGLRAEVSSRPVPTPTLAFEIRRRGAAGAVNFTASHNPPRYLGIKFSTSDGAPALPELTQRFESAIAALSDVPAPEGSAPATEFDPVSGYLDDLARKVDGSAVAAGDPHFSLDFRYGTSAGFLDGFLERAGTRFNRLNAKRDPLFGGESPQCGEKELVHLAEEVRRSGSRLGLACDGDADRFGVCDERGTYVAPNAILALLLRDLLGRKGRRGGVARSVATTHALDAIAAKFGVPCYETPVGFKYIGEKLIAGEIIFGGEESAGLTVEGHVPEKDGILADLLVAEMCGATGKTIGELSAELDREIGPFRSTRLDLPLSPAERERLAQMRESPPDRVGARRVTSVNRIDGIKLLLDDGSWILVRESGTEPLARVYVESKSEEKVAALTHAARQLVAVA